MLPQRQRILDQFAHELPTRKARFDEGFEQMCLRPEARQPLRNILRPNPPALLITTHAHRLSVRREPAWDWLALPATALELDEMVDVPSHHVPASDDRVGWLALRRDGKGWHADLHPVDHG